MKFSKLAFLCLAVVFVLFSAGCSSTNLATTNTGWSDYAEIVTKNYEVVGHVRLEAQETKTVSMLSINTTIEGSTITYDDLLAQAIELGADDIINVRIDKVEDSSHSFFDLILGYTTNYTYYANAIAIRYTEPVADVAATENHEDPDVGRSQFVAPSIFDLLQ
ncbi:MAG: hypothetical protein ACLFR1_15500 [Spirochaetia bacterium]